MDLGVNYVSHFIVMNYPQLGSFVGEDVQGLIGQFCRLSPYLEILRKDTKGLHIYKELKQPPVFDICSCL